MILSETLIIKNTFSHHFTASSISSPQGLHHSHNQNTYTESLCLQQFQGQSSNESLINTIDSTPRHGFPFFRSLPFHRTSIQRSDSKRTFIVFVANFSERCSFFQPLFFRFFFFFLAGFAIIFETLIVVIRIFI